MERVLIIADNFRIPNLGHLKLLEAIQQKMKEFNIIKTYIFISYEIGDTLNYFQKESLLKKIITNSEMFQIVEIDNLKISKEIKQIALNREDILAIYVDPFQKSFVEHSVEGLPVEVREFYTKVDINMLEESIIQNNYQVFCNMMPNKLWSEFQNLKEIYNFNKLSEHIINFKSFLKKNKYRGI